MSRKTARSSAVTVAILAAAAIVVNTAPASAPLTFQKYRDDGFGGPVTHRRVVPLWHERASTSRAALRRVRCASQVAQARGTACFIAQR